MRRRRTAIGALLWLLGLLVSPGLHAAAFVSGWELDHLSGDGLRSWQDGGSGKLAVAGDRLSLRGFVAARERLTDTLSATAVLLADNTPGNPRLGISEAYLRWRPVPRNRLRLMSRLGVFYPAISLENDRPGWRSPYSQAFSAINSWIGEELRTAGGEIGLELRPSSYAGQRIGLTAGVFAGNDTAGSLLAWRGWSLHTHQSRLRDELALAPLPQIQPEGLFARQSGATQPFVELDGRPGYYLSAEWRAARRFTLRAMHYDNRANPTAVEDGQYGWATRFASAGARVEWRGLEWVGQWMDGRTRMGGVSRVDADFRSWFVLLSRGFGPHRLSARYDDFDVRDRDTTARDSNDETGDGFTLAYRLRLKARWELHAEWLRIDTRRRAFMYFDHPPAARETAWRFGFSWRS